MPRLVVTTNEGTVVEMWDSDDLAEWNFDKSMARQHFMSEVMDAIIRAKTIEER